MVTLVEELPFAFAVDAAFVSTTCSFCFAHGQTVHKCTGCHMLSYCNKECQRNDWVNHKKECRLLKRWKTLSTVVPDDNTRVTCRILLKSEEELGQVAYNGRTWNSLMDHVADVKSTKNLHSMCFDIQVNAIKMLLQPAKDVSNQEIEKVLSRVKTNAFGPTDKQTGSITVGCAVYLGLSVHNHSCIPDANFVSLGNKGVLRSVDPNTKYSNDLTVSYVSRAPFAFDRKKDLKESYFFDCTCPLCADDGHIMNRMGASCNVECCKDGVGLWDKNDVYKCSKCNSPSSIKRAKVLDAEDDISTILNNTNALSKDSLVTHGVEMLKKYKKVLSTYNYKMVDLCGTVRKAACETGKYVETVKRMYDEVEAAYLYYLPIGDRERTHWLVGRAFMEFMEKGGRPSPRMKQAFEETLLTLGEEHPMTKRVMEMNMARR